MTNLSVFTFESQPVRLVGTAEKPEWVAQDVCVVLGIQRTSDAISSFDNDEKGTVIIRTPGGEQQMLTVTEPGLYRLIFKSRKTVAKRFQRWVFHEVLPSIRKKGSYTLPQPELERLKLELELAKTQERLLTTTSALATMHGSGMVALILGKPDAVITPTERVETVVTVDRHGRPIHQFDGVGITYLAKRYGFGCNTKACRYWLESIGVKDEQWLSEPTLVKSQKLSRDLLPWLDRQYAARTGVRQQLLGE
jgi:prophage antirepressor-like protein